MTPLDCVQALASRLESQPSDYDRLLEQVGEGKIVVWSPPPAQRRP